MDQTFLRHYKREKGRVNSTYSGRRAKNIITQSGNKRREIGLDLPAAVIIGENRGGWDVSHWAKIRSYSMAISYFMI